MVFFGDSFLSPDDRRESCLLCHISQPFVYDLICVCGRRFIKHSLVKSEMKLSFKRSIQGYPS